jgi:SAM-dependent methyltransferase
MASHWIYDRSSLYSLEWLALQPRSWLNVHAGLDEFTPLLVERLRSGQHSVFDIFDPKEMTELSIARAREISGSTPSQPVSWQQLPSGDGAFDGVFLLFVAHEFRRDNSRHIFFKELARVLAPGGCVVMIEHLRDLPNFLAFGPGFLHFQSRSAWRSAFRVASLEVASERTITPFVRVFELRRAV